MRILIAEDDLTSRTVLTAVLERYDHEVVTARDGLEAWELFQGGAAPRLLILDWMMPGMDGLEVCQRVRALETDDPPYIIMLTALDDMEHLVRALDSGADDYVPKPFDHSELRARVAVGERLLRLRNRLISRTKELKEALDQVKTLRGYIPICCHCKRVRDDSDYWREVEDYVSEHTEALFSHGLCPECLRVHYPEDM